MKLLIVVPALCKGGVERLVSVLSKEWKKNHHVKIIVFDENNIAYSYGGDLTTLKLPSKVGIFFKIVQLFRRTSQLIKLFKQNEPDYIISFSETANFPSIFAAYFSGKLKKLTVSVHADTKIIPKFHSFLIPYLYRIPQKIIAVSKGVSYALINLGISKKKIKVINNPLPASTPSISKPLPRPLSAPVNYILGVGRLDKYKGFDLLIEAFSNLEDLNIHLVILGEGEERETLENIVLSKGISERVHLLGLVKDTWPWYRHAKLFVSSSLSEGWGNVIVESMSQGCPVIAFDCDYGPREIITNGYNGLLVKTNDVKSLTNTITTLINDIHLSNKLQQYGLTRISEFNVKSLSVKWLNDN